MKTILLSTAGAGALVAIAAGFAGLTILVGMGAGAMVISLILLGWLNEDESTEPADRADRGR